MPSPDLLLALAEARQRQERARREVERLESVFTSLAHDEAAVRHKIATGLARDDPWAKGSLNSIQANLDNIRPRYEQALAELRDAERAVTHAMHSYDHEEFEQSRQ